MNKVIFVIIKKVLLLLLLLLLFSLKTLLCDFCAINIPGFLKTGSAKITTHSTTWQFRTIKLIQRPIKGLYLTPGSKFMVPRSIPATPNLKA